MSRAPVIARRELASYFVSPIAYVAMAVFLVVCGGVFWKDFEPGHPAELRHLFEGMIWILLMIVPLLCMGLLAQEKASGTIETLMTAPVGEVDVVLGKFFGSVMFLLMLLLPTLLYVVLMFAFGKPDIGPILAGYLGIVLAGAMFISVALFCSSFTKNQVIAAAVSSFILVLVTVVPHMVLTEAAIAPWLRSALRQAVYHRYDDFTKGVIDFGNVTFFVAITVVFLFLTTKVLEARRWK